MIWYCDSSALVKRYVRETGSRWLREQISHHQLLTSVLAIAEIPAALARRQRDGTLSVFEFHRSRLQITRHLQAGQYALLPATLHVIQQAALLIYRLPLAGYDAVHLATAIHYLRTSGIDANQFYFLTADLQLQRAAEAEGLKTENPNNHP
ncbi:MAG: type II toxin-antitoxin system VapC family toxin [Blastocatellia bacterium]